MTRIRCAMPAGSQGEPYAQRRRARLVEEDVHRWVFAHDVDPEVESAVREWLTVRLGGFHCDLQVMYTPHVIGPALARTHIVLNNTPPLSSIARADEAVEVDARGLTPTDAAKALIEATGLDPHASVRGWPFCLDDLDGANDVDDMEGGAT